jgi:hypothetical protein
MADDAVPTSANEAHATAARAMSAAPAWFAANAPSVPDAPAPEDHSEAKPAEAAVETAPVTSEPQEPAAGDKPVDDGQSAPSSDVPPPEQAAAPTTETEWDRWLKRYGGDPNAAGKAAFEADSRAAEFAKKLKEREGATPAPTAEPAASTPAPEPPVAAKTAEPPAAPASAFMDRVQKAVEQDGQCKAYLTEFNTNQEKLSKIGYDPATAKVVGGDLAQIQKRLEVIDLHLSPERQKALGVTLPALGDFEAAELRQKRDELRGEERDLIHEARLLTDQQGAIRRNHLQRVEHHAGTIRTELERDQARQANEGRLNETMAAVEAQWNSELPKVLQELKVAPDQVEKFKTRLTKEARLDPVAAARDMPAFMRRAGQEIANDYAEEGKRFRSAQMADYGAQKRKDASVNAPAPQAAVVDAPKTAPRFTSKDADRRAAQASRDFVRSLNAR